MRDVSEVCASHGMGACVSTSVCVSIHAHALVYTCICARQLAGGWGETHGWGRKS